MGTPAPARRYLVRFDDICPTMNWKVWDAIEATLVQHQIRPILAVVPDNQDPELVVDPPRPDFWERVRGWQAMGWTIALHGYQHLYVNRDWGLMQLTRQSEFAGLAREAQAEKLRKALAIFEKHGVRADAWVAPSHSFDRITLQLLAELGVRVVSDGLWPWPFTDRDGIFWLPQQLWSFHPRGRGVWTVCHHHNHWSGPRLSAFRDEMAGHAGEMADLRQVLESHGRMPQTMLNRWLGYRRLLWEHRVHSLFYRFRHRSR